MVYPNPITAMLLAFLASVTPEGPSSPEPERIARDVHLLRGEFVPGRQPDGNTVILRGPEGLIVVDTGRHAAHTQSILDFATAEAAPVVAVVNTHWHLDHIGGNPLLRRAFPAAKVHASAAIEGAMTGFLARYRKELVAMRAAGKDAAKNASFDEEIARIDAGPALRPDVVVTAPGRRELGGRMLRFGLEARAVTEGDVWIYDPASKVLIAGDLVTLPVPFLDTACPTRWRDSLDRLAQEPFRTLVPGHGAPMTRAQFEMWRSAYSNLLDCAAGESAAAQCIAGWRKDADALLHDAESEQAGSMLEYYLGQVLRGDPERLATACAEPDTATASRRRGGFGPLALP